MAENVVADIGLIGLAVMGENLALNIADHGFKCAVYNRTTETMRKFVAREKHPNLVPCETMKDLVAAIKRPRKFIVLVKAGPAVDAVTKELLDAGIAPDDIVVDCGNSLWTDTIRRERDYASKCKFFGSGVSGGELGARFGPSMMPGGDPESWKHLKPIWEAVAAKVDAKTGKPMEDYAPGKPVVGGVPCTAYCGPNGAGHYVKMIHNGIEYIDMQLICEAYTLMQNLLGMKAPDLAKVFARWNEGDLDSYLIQITADILQQPDPNHKDGYLVDYILDTAGQKGTGKWTSVNALDMGIPANAISEAVFARCLSALKDERVGASKVLVGPSNATDNGQLTTDEIRDALYCSKICAYAQGFQLMREAQNEYKWKFNFAEIASIWRGGCIIRARFLQKITDAYKRDANLVNLLLDPYFNEQIKKGQANWRKIVGLAAANGVAAPAFMSALAYYDGYRSARLPANLLQAQRDYFGAHTYERTDQPRGHFFHLDWPEKGRPQIAIPVPEKREAQPTTEKKAAKVYSSMPDPNYIVPIKVHNDLVEAAYRHRGFTADEAAAAARFSQMTSWHGIKTHNAIKALHLDEHFGSKAGGCVPGAKIEKLPSKYKAVQRWNANKKLGQATAFEAMDTCMKLADEFGVGVVAVNNAFHYLWGGGYVIDAANKGYIAYTCCTAALAEVVPFGGKFPTLGTNPHSWGFPTTDAVGFPVCVDWATSIVAMGRIQQFVREKKPIPIGWAVDKDGNETTDPSKVAALFPFGQHKGYGLSLIDELMAAFIGGSLPTLRSRWGEGPKDEKRTPNFFFQCIRADALDCGDFAQGRSQAKNVKAVIDDIRSRGNESCLLPGEPEARFAKLSEKHGGLLFTQAEVDAFTEIAKEANVKFEISNLKSIEI